MLKRYPVITDHTMPFWHVAGRGGRTKFAGVGRVGRRGECKCGFGSSRDRKGRLIFPATEGGPPGTTGAWLPRRVVGAGSAWRGNRGRKAASAPPGGAPGSGSAVDCESARIVCLEPARGALRRRPRLKRQRLWSPDGRVAEQGLHRGLSIVNGPPQGTETGRSQVRRTREFVCSLPGTARRLRGRPYSMWHF